MAFFNIPDKTDLIIKKMLILISNRGIYNLNPAFPSPLFTNPITRQDIKSVIAINIKEK